LTKFRKTDILHAQAVAGLLTCDVWLFYEIALHRNALGHEPLLMTGRIFYELGGKMTDEEMRECLRFRLRQDPEGTIHVIVKAMMASGWTFDGAIDDLLAAIESKEEYNGE
jgi:hypothetical protein